MESSKADCRVVSYLLHNCTKGIVYSGSRLDMRGYTDSDRGSDKHTRRSKQGYVVVMAGVPLSWL